jgi:hypothetical protein
MKPCYDEIPEEMRELPNWIVWRLEKRANKSGVVKETKVPYNARSGRHAQSNNPATWSTFGAAMEALKKGCFNGPGFCITQPIIVADFDGCRDPGGILEPWAEQMVDELDAPTEISPSRTGVHSFVKGELPPGPRQKEFGDRAHHGIGLYDAARGRYIAMTGERIRGGATIPDRTEELRRIHARLFPPQPPKAKPKAKAKTGASLADDDLIAKALKANDGGKFSRLWNGQWEGEYASQSEADLALCMKLAFWTGRDASQIDALFRRSGLLRKKWERQDYREATITKAMNQTTETWKPHPVAPSSAVIDLNRLQPSLELLNSLIVWQGRIQFISVKRRGPMLIATTTGNLEIVWPSTTELGSFAKSQAIISDTTNVWIPTPGQRQIRVQWEPAVTLLLQLAAEDGIRLEPALKEEIRDLVRLMWRAAGQPVAMDSGEFIDYMRAVQHTRRSPAGACPPCVFAAEEQAWIHVPSFRAWLSLPSLTNKLYPLTDVRNGLLLLGFTYCENLSRGHEGESETVCLWRGPLEVLGSLPEEPEK